MKKIKCFQIDWNNYDEVDKLYRSIKGRRSALKHELGLLKRKSQTEIFRNELSILNNK